MDRTQWHGENRRRSENTVGEVAWTSVLLGLLGTGLAGAGLLLDGPGIERLDAVLVGVAVSAVVGYNGYRERHRHLKHPDGIRAVAILSLWLIPFSLAHDGGRLALLTDVSLVVGALTLGLSAVEYLNRFKYRPSRRTAARAESAGVRSVVADVTERVTDAAGRLSSREFVLPLLLALPVGVGAGLGAAAFRFLMYAVHTFLFGKVLPLLPSHAWIALLPVVGAGVAGVLIYGLAPEAAGHGVPENMEAIAVNGGQIRHRLPPFKVLVSALTLGAGGSGGREGPIARIGAGVGSSLGQLCGLSAGNTRLLLAAGIAGGIGATFGAPVGGVLFGAEIVMLYRVDRYNLVVLAATTLVAVLTARTLAPHFTWFAFLPFPLPALSVTPSDVAFAVPYGLLMGIAAWLWVSILERTERAFDGVAVPDHIKPAIGAVPVGVLGVFYAKYGVMGVGYSGLQVAVESVGTGAVLLLTLAVAKLVATQFTIGSGGSGGVFAPTLYIGGLFAVGVHHLFGTLPVSSALVGIVGMATIFSGAASAPLTATFLIAEVFDDYALVAVLALPCLISYALSNRLFEASIYTSRLHRKGILNDYTEKAGQIGPNGDDSRNDSAGRTAVGQQSTQSMD